MLKASGGSVGEGLDDEALARFAQSVELALVRAYDIGSAMLTAATAAATAATFRRHHVDHAAALGRLSVLEGVVGAPNRLLVAQLLTTLQAPRAERDVLAALFDLEDDAAATYQFALERLASADVVHEVAAILPVESQHAVVLGTLLGKQAREMIPPFQRRDGFFDPARYPIA